MTSRKQPSIFIAVYFTFAALFASPSYATDRNKSCDQRRLPSLAALSTATKDIHLTEFEIKTEEIEIEIFRINEEMKQIPLSISVTGKSSHTSEISNKFWSKDYGEVVGVNTSYDVNAWKQKLRASAQSAQLQIYEAQLQANKNDEYKSKISTLIDIVESKELSKILSSQQDVFARKLEYFTQLQIGGETKQLEISETKIRLREISDKSTANRIKLNQKLSYVGLSKDNIASDQILSLFELPPYDNSCLFDPSELKKLAAEIRLLDIEADYLNFINRFDLSVSVSLKQRRTHLGHNNEASISLNGKFPLYDGGKNSTDRLISTKSKTLKTKNLKRAKQDLYLLLEQRSSSEAVFIASIVSLDEQITEIKRNLVELNARQQMGQSVFLEVSDKNLEKLKLQEAQLRLKCDFLQDWITFLRKVNGFKKT